MARYTIEEYKKHIFSLEDGWADDKDAKRFKESTWEIAMKFVKRLKKLGLPSILPCVPHDIDLSWRIKDKIGLLLNIDGDTEDVDYYGDDNNNNEVKGNNEDFETTISKIMNWYNTMSQNGILK